MKFNYKAAVTGLVGGLFGLYLLHLGYPFPTPQFFILYGAFLLAMLLGAW